MSQGSNNGTTKRSILKFLIGKKFFCLIKIERDVTVWWNRIIIFALKQQRDRDRAYNRLHSNVSFKEIKLLHIVFFCKVSLEIRSTKTKIVVLYVSNKH